MALLDAKFVALAIRLLNKFGASVTISMKDGGSSFDVATGLRDTGSDTSFPAKIVPPQIAREMVRDGHAESEIITFISPNDFAGKDMKMADKITMPNGHIYSIVEKIEIYSGDEVALIRMELE